MIGDVENLLHAAVVFQSTGGSVREITLEARRISLNHHLAARNK
jgi:hypothetical protein